MLLQQGRGEEVSLARNAGGSSASAAESETVRFHKLSYHHAKTTVGVGRSVRYTYLGVIALRVAFFMRWESELVDGVLLICWSGVVTGPNILTTAQRKHL